MRLVLFIAVVALVVDALKFDGAYTQSAFRYVTVATEQLIGRFDDAEPVGSAARQPETSEGGTSKGGTSEDGTSADTTHL